MHVIAARRAAPHADPHAAALSTLIAVAAFAAAVGIVGAAGPAAAETEAEENANIGVVNAFIAAWDDPDRAVAFLADDASVRMVEDQPPVVGRPAVLDAFKRFMKPGVTLTVETLETTAHGPVVVNRRIDTMKTKGEPDQVFPISGVFVVKGGKIVEWTDYLDR
ncbi:MAG: limonene-1,2-epoxide hydrolase family protein [Myxococcota bacterium]